MKRWYEIKALNPMTAEMRVYGVISKDDVNPKDFIASLRELENKYPNINVRLNCEGGDVFGGLAIYNAMKQSKAKIDTYNDGLAASMGSVILQGANRKRYMAKNARVMTHQPSGAAQGQADDLRSIADVMDGLANDMKDIYKANTKQDDTMIESWMQKGVDRWFNADEAKEARLVDDIIDPTADIDETSLVGLTSLAIVAKFNEKLTSQNLMDKNLLIVALGLSANASDTDIIAAIQNLANKAKTFQSQNETLTAQLDAQKKLAIEAMLNEAEESGKITAEQKPLYRGLAEKDPESTQKVLAGIKPVQLPSQIIVAKGGKDNSVPDGRESWTYLDYMKKAPGDLEVMAKNDPKKFTALYKNQFGNTPVL